MIFPDDSPKRVGDVVQNVHPWGHHESGVVINVWSVHTAEDSVCVRTGPGSTTSGPACNWAAVLDSDTAWAIRARAQAPAWPRMPFGAMAA